MAQFQEIVLLFPQIVKYLKDEGTELLRLDEAEVEAEVEADKKAALEGVDDQVEEDEEAEEAKDVKRNLDQLSSKPPTDSSTGKKSAVESKDHNTARSPRNIAGKAEHIKEESDSDDNEVVVSKSKRKRASIKQNWELTSDEDE
jgi:hypothetical protein